MARGRFISNKISISSRVNELPIPAALLYTWMIPHLDVEGRMQGDARLVKQLVFPMKNYSVKQVESWLKMMEDSLDAETGFGLITRYEVGGRKFIWMAGFDTEQSNKGGSVWKTREQPSVLPPPPAKYIKQAEDAGLIITKQKSKERQDKDAIDEVNHAPKLAEIYEQNIGMITPLISDKLIDISKRYPESWFKEAVEIACNQNVRKLSYIETILENWKTKGKNGNGKPEKPVTDVTEQYEVA